MSDGDAQTVGEPWPTGAVTDEDAAFEQRLPHLPARLVARPEQDEVGAAREDVEVELGKCGRDALPLVDDRCDAGVHLVGVVQRQAAGDLLGSIEVIRKHHLVELRNDRRWADQVAETACRHRPRLRERSYHDERHRLVDHGQCRPVGELTVRLVDDEQTRLRIEDCTHVARRLDETRGVVGRTQERDCGPVLADQFDRAIDVELEVSTALAFHDCGTGEAGDVSMQLIRRLEGDDRAAGAAVGEQQCLQHFVRTVCGEHLVGPHVVRFCDGAAQRRSRCGRDSDAIRLARARQRMRRARPPVAAVRRLVGVEANADVDLRRVIALESSQIVAYRHRVHSRPRYRQSARPGSLDFVCSARQTDVMNDPLAATLTVIAEHVERYRQQLAEVGPTHVPPSREDVQAAVREAEQALRNAERLLRRALKVIG